MNLRIEKKGGSYYEKSNSFSGSSWDTDALAENIPMLNDLNTYKDEELIKFVNGTRSFDTWDQFLEECDGIGLQDYINEYTRQYQEQKES